MTLHTIDPDPELVDVIRNALARLLARPHRRDDGLDRLDPQTAVLSVPHPVYALGLTELAAAAPGTTVLSDARPVAQRFLVGDAQGVVAAAEVADATGRGLAITQGHYIPEMLRALDRAERRDDFGEVEVRTLRVPPLHVTALWLHGLEEQGDVLMPLAPAPLPLEPNRFYAEAELSQTLARLAKVRSAQPTPGGNGGAGSGAGAVPTSAPGAGPAAPPRDGPGG